MCWRNSQYWLSKWDMIPYSNIDCSIQQICLNCCDNQMKRRRDCLKARMLDDYRYGGEFTYGDKPKEWNRPLMAHMYYNRKQNRLSAMTRKGVCTTNFLKFFFQSPHYDRKNREENERFYFADPFETRSRVIDPPLSEYTNFEEYFGDYYFQQWLNLRRSNGKEGVFPKMSPQWVRAWYEFYRDVVAPDSNGSWYDFNKFNVQSLHTKKLVEKSSKRRETTIRQQSVAVSDSNGRKSARNTELFDEMVRSLGEDYLETTPTTIRDYDQNTTENKADIIEKVFDEYRPQKTRNERKWKSTLDDERDSYLDELSRLKRTESILQPFVFHAPFSKTKQDSFKQKVYVTEELDPYGRHEKELTKAEKSERRATYEKDRRDQMYEKSESNKKNFQQRDVPKGKPLRPKWTSKRQANHEISNLYAQYMDILEKIRRRKLLEKHERSGLHSHRNRIIPKINNCYRLAKWNQIPYANIDFSIQQICRNCIYRTDYCPNYEEYRWQGSCRPGNEFDKGLNRWNRYLMSDNQIVTNRSRLARMIRGGVCTTDFFKSFMLMPSSNDYKSNISEDPFEVNAIQAPVSYLGTCYMPSKYKAQSSFCAHLDKCNYHTLFFQRQRLQPKGQQILKEERLYRRKEKFKNMKKWMKDLYELYNKITGHPRITDTFNDYLCKDGENRENAQHGHKFCLSDVGTLKSEFLHSKNFCRNICPNHQLFRKQMKIFKGDSINKVVVHDETDKSPKRTHSRDTPSTHRSSLFTNLTPPREPALKGSLPYHDPPYKELSNRGSSPKDVQISREKSSKEETSYHETSLKDVATSREQNLKDDTNHRERTNEQSLKEEIPYHGTSLKDTSFSREQSLKEEIPYCETSFRDVSINREQNSKDEMPYRETPCKDTPSSHEQNLQEGASQREPLSKDSLTSHERTLKEYTLHDGVCSKDISDSQGQSLKELKFYRGTFLKDALSSCEESLEKGGSYCEVLPIVEVPSSCKQHLKKAKCYHEPSLKGVPSSRKQNLKEKTSYSGTFENDLSDREQDLKKTCHREIFCKDAPTSRDRSMEEVYFCKTALKNTSSAHEQSLKEKSISRETSASSSRGHCLKNKLSNYETYARDIHRESILRSKRMYCDRNLEDISLNNESSLKNTRSSCKSSVKPRSIPEPTLKHCSMHSKLSPKYSSSPSHAQTPIERRHHRASTNDFLRFPRLCQRTSSSYNKPPHIKNTSPVENFECPCQHIDFARKFVEGKRDRISNIDACKKRRVDKSLSIFEVYSVYKNKPLTALSPILRQCSSPSFHEAKSLWKDHLEFLAILKHLGEDEQTGSSRIDRYY